MTRPSLLVLGLLSMPFLISCGEKDDDDKAVAAKASASLAFENKSTASLNLAKPAVFQMKLIAAYVSVGVASDGSNSGATTMIYLNPDCKDNIGICDIAGGNHGAGGAAITNIVTSYFDFAKSSTEVNTALNAQNREIVLWEPSGDAKPEDKPADLSVTFNYASLEFCKMASKPATNIKWGASASSTNEYLRTACTVRSEPLNPPITVKEGEVVKFSLAYSLDDTIQTGAAATGEDCIGEGAAKTCFSMPKFTPSASK